MARNNLPKLLITGSEGMIGKKLCRHFESKFEVIKLDLSLGHDLTDEEFVRVWFRKNRGLYGMIICHAYNPVVPPGKASGRKREPDEVPLKELRNYFEINSVSAFDVCRNFIKNNSNGTIINVSSIYGTVSPHHDIYKNFVKPIGYSMSKAALNIMSKYLAAYYGPKFRVNTVILGGVAAGKESTEFIDRYSAHTPLKRLMKLDEATSVFDFLLDEKSSYVTGAEILVDGGWTAW